MTFGTCPAPAGGSPLGSRPSLLQWCGASVKLQANCAIHSPEHRLNPLASEAVSGKIESRVDTTLDGLPVYQSSASILGPGYTSGLKKATYSLRNTMS